MADLKAKQIKFPLTGTSIVSSSAQIATDISGSFTSGFEYTGKISGSSVSTGSFGRVEVGTGGIDTAGDLTLDGDGGDIILKDGGTEFGRFTQLIGGLTLKSGPNAVNAVIIGTDSNPNIILGGEIQTSYNITGSSVTTGSFGKVVIGEMGNKDVTSVSSSISTRLTTAETELGNTLFSSSAQVDHDATTNFVANEHIDHTSVSVIAGTGMTGGGTIAANRTLNVIGGTGVTANADDIAIGQDVSTTSNVLFANITGSNISGSSLLGVVGTATQGTIDIHSLSGYVANENIDHSGVTITAGDGLTGGGTIESTRTLTVGAGTGITVNTNDVATDDSAIVHDDLSGFVANEHIDHTSVTLTAGAGLTGGGTIASNRTFAVGAGTGITVNANDVAIGQSVATNANVNFATITTTGNITAQGDIIAENYIVSSSVTHLTSSAISGSSIFGDTQDDTHQFTGSVFVTGSTFNIDSLGSVSSSNSGSFLNVKAANNVNATNIYGTLSTATQGTIDHDSLANFVADEHVAHGGVSVVAGDGLTGGGTIASNRTINVVGGDGITANANDVAITAAQTTITSIFAEDLKIGEDDQTKIDFETANQINFYGDNVKLLELSNANTGDAVFNVATADKNFTITGTDGSTAITALDIDMAAAGNAQFIGNISGSQIEASGDVIAFGSSDRRLKDNITPIENPLEKMDKIGGYTFDWNEKQDAYKGHDVGVIAQEIEEILPELVTTRGTGYKAVKYEKIVPLLIESIKELQKKVQKIEENCDCLNK